MGVAESIAFLGLATSVGGGVLGSIVMVSRQFAEFRADFSVIKWRLERIEDELNVTPEGDRNGK